MKTSLSAGKLVLQQGAVAGLSGALCDEQERMWRFLKKTNWGDIDVPVNLKTMQLKREALVGLISKNPSPCIQDV